ncbi:hypothetical protein C8Q79DRAFT_891669, partial [Trametes meyenii]
LVKVAKKYNVRCEARNPAKDLREQVPIWHHMGTKQGKSVANTVASKCLRERHGVTTVAQCAGVAKRLKEGGEDNHWKNAGCECHDCDVDRRVRGCDNPHRCATAAGKALEKLTMKWRPERRENEDGLSRTRRQELNEENGQTEGRIVFNPSVATEAPLANAFRIFGEEGEGARGVALRTRRPRNVEEEETEVHTDGSCKKDELEEARAGSGVWFARGDRRNRSERLPGEVQTNQAAEVYAVIMAGREAPPFAPLHIVSD